jgi:hypothetical protein
VPVAGGMFRIVARRPKSAGDSVCESTRVGTLASPYSSTSEATYPRDFSGKELGL